MAVRTPVNPLGLSQEGIVDVVKHVEESLSHIETDGSFGTVASSVIEEAFRIIGVNEYDTQIGYSEERTTCYTFVTEGDVFEVTVHLRSAPME